MMKVLLLIAICITIVYCGKKNYKKVGCWKDAASRAMPTLEGVESTLIGPYPHRSDAIKKCYEAARKRGHVYFAIQNGGWCAAGGFHQKYGRSTACVPDGKGGPWANEVYEITNPQEFQNLGCWRDTIHRALPQLDGVETSVSGPYQHRHDAIRKCYEAAKKRGRQYFSVQNGGWCAGGGDTYERYGRSTACKANGKGGAWANEVYKIANLDYTSLGCWKDAKDRALTPVEGTDASLMGPYQTRHDAIKKCHAVAVERGYRYFAVQHNGWCSAGDTSYRKYGQSGGCHANGRGGAWTNNVYFVSSLNYTNVGCWVDNRHRALPTLEGTTQILNGPYQHRADAIRKCYKVAVAKGHHYFALQNGGWCASGGDSFSKYGASAACKNHGKGGPWANQVYAIISHN